VRTTKNWALEDSGTNLVPLAGYEADPEAGESVKDSARELLAPGEAMVEDVEEQAPWVEEEAGAFDAHMADSDMNFGHRMPGAAFEQESVVG